MSKDTHTKYLVARKLLHKGIELKESELEMIDNVYFEYRKESIKKIILYRRINVVFAFISILLWFAINQTAFEKYFLLIIGILFVTANMIQWILHEIALKRLKMNYYNGGNEN